ncbi:efflux RND transporter permease subunit [sulfur-oxidizing endosymbiont of Gigantopelta aegis]|uniref:efflux RND transporter permease subunit n=1 Tax=sulfur-oxidizing endosymbiont of Gigantopelta aegis TaxID=2794934 RepID=UPI0018DDD50C|nr:efflux RND transporter permease subunit [sulfur-oxidizing endosymbiont of Gigantopelta aegis]
MRVVNLSEWGLRHRSLTIYLMVVLVFMGVLAYRDLGQAEDPKFTIKLMAVKTFWPGATALEVELQVTERIEKKLQEVPWLDFLSSYSKPGESMVFVTLKDYTPHDEVEKSWYQARKKLDDIRHTFPVGVQGPFPNDEYGDTFGIIYAFSGDGFSYAQLRDYVDDVRLQLLNVKNVAKADLLGVQEEKIFIEISNVKLSKLGLQPTQIFDTLNQQNYLTPAGDVNTDSDRIYIRVSRLESVEEIRKVGIRSNGRLFRLGDIASVYRTYADPPDFKMHFMGEEVIGLALTMSKGGDILKLGETLKKTIKEIQENLPIGIEIHTVADQPAVVAHSVNEFMDVLRDALIIVLAVSFISLGLRTGLVVALSIPMVLAITFLGMKLWGIDLQRISLGALIIALGLLVDDAMISVEMMSSKMEQGMDRFKAAVYAYTHTAFPMLTGTLITVAGFLPVFLAKSSASEYTGSLFVVVGLALMTSWFVAVLFMPFLGYRLLPDFHASNASGAVKDIYQKRFYRIFRAIVTWCVNWRKTVIIITLIIFSVSIYSFRFVESQFFPSSKRNEIMVDLWLPQGSSFQATENYTKRFEKILENDDNIINYVAYVGSGAPRFYLPLDQELKHSNLTQFVIMTRNNEAREVVRKRLIKAFDEQFIDIRGRVMRLENGPPIGYPIQFRVQGKDKDILRKIAAEVAVFMRANPYVANVNFNWNELSKVVKLSIDQDKARVLGISSQELAVVINSILSGYSITHFRDENELIEVLARAEKSERIGLGNLSDVRIPTNNGTFVPLSQIVSLSYELEEGLIWRRDLQPTITVRADVKGHMQAATVSKQIEPQLDSIRERLPRGYSIELGGVVEESAKGETAIMAVMPVVVLSVFTLLMIQLQSFQRTIIVILTAPLGIIGVSAALLLFNAPYGFVANLGVIALSGMIMRNSVILVDQIERDREDGATMKQAIIEAAVRRLRPIALTAAASVLAMVPLSTNTFWGPMAMSIMGGLVIATLLTLLFLPALYAAWFKA